MRGPFAYPVRLGGGEQLGRPHEGVARAPDLLKVAEGDQRPVLPQRVLDFGGHGLPICYVGYVQHRPRRKYVLQPVQQQSKSSNIKEGARGHHTIACFEPTPNRWSVDPV